MTSHLRDETQWAVEVGERLRMLQGSFADDDPEARREYLREEVQRALRGVAATRKTIYLQALAERFPAWAAPERAVPASQTATPPPPSDSAASLVDRLAEMAAQIPEAERLALTYRLQQAGFSVVLPAPATAGAAAEEVPLELQKKLALDPDQPLDRQRALKLAAVLIDLVVTMDQLAWNLWKTLAPNSIVRREAGPTGDLRKIAGPYIIGDNEVSTVQITQLLDKTRQLIAGLLAAIGSTGEAFARQYLARFSPQSIKEMADAEPGFFIGPEQKCWRKYLQLFNEVSGVTIENEITGAIVKYTEDIIMGANRSASSSHAPRG